MMRGHWKRSLALAALLALIATQLSGCIQTKEIKDLLIVTGIAVDKAEEAGMLDVCLQAAKLNQESAGGPSDPGSGGESAVILRKAQGRTLMQSIISIDRSSTQVAFVHHAQAILFGAELAAEGLARQIDLIVREPDARIEVPLFVTEGRAEAFMDIAMDQVPISGQFLSGTVEAMGDISPLYNIRVFDFLTRMLDGTSAPMATLIRTVKQDDQELIEIAGMAVFVGDRYVGALDNEEVLGYIWAMGDVHNSHVMAVAGDDVAMLLINSLRSERTVTFRQDGGVQVTLRVRADLHIGELAGFADLEGEALILRLCEIGGAAIQQRIEATYARAREMGADIYRIGTWLRRWRPDDWERMEEYWPALFRDSVLDVRVETDISSIGQMPRSLIREEQDEH